MPVEVIALAPLGVPPLGMAQLDEAPPLKVEPPLEVLPLARSLRLPVVQAWEVGREYGGY